MSPLSTMPDVDTIDFSKQNGLVPVVAQDAETGAVLMLAFANHEAVVRTIMTRSLHFWSRSRRALWRKGETTGNILELESLHADCDRDTLLALVRPVGPTCHTGARTCFGDEVTSSPSTSPEDPVSPDALDALDRTLAARAADRPAGSYTVRLLDDTNLRLKKLGEESAELLAALATGDRDRAVEEAADLVYHILVGLRAEGVGLDEVRGVLASRVG